MARNVYVVKHPDGWAVRNEGNSRASRVTSTQREAIDIARPLAKRQEGELTIQNRHGQFRSKDSYGNDPCPPKDKEH
jgi:hypothetical protein